uniref:Uncharacterized protein n=1 Tax=Bursaphelenchus xylophilus TaxID=6326 RepID=A0A1I7RSX8_BURXY
MVRGSRNWTWNGAPEHTHQAHRKGYLRKRRASGPTPIQPSRKHTSSSTLTPASSLFANGHAERLEKTVGRTESGMDKHDHGRKTSHSIPCCQRSGTMREKER